MLYLFLNVFKNILVIMVFYFTSNVVDPPATLYMGDDKEENELLIKWGWPEDVWFHVDKLSSAHVYLRLQPGQRLEDIPEALVEDCCQLVKANSIEGCKLAETDVIYTMWSNLKKTADMVTGQVGFHSNRAVKKVRVQKQKDIVNRLNKTKVHKENVDFRVLKEERDTQERQKTKEQQRLHRQREEADRAARELEKQNKSYDRVFESDNVGMTNKNTDGRDLEEDFM